MAEIRRFIFLLTIRLIIICSSTSHTEAICCISNIKNCSFGAKLKSNLIFHFNNFGFFSIVSKDFCKLLATNKQIELHSGKRVLLYFISRFVICGELKLLKSRVVETKLCLLI